MSEPILQAPNETGRLYLLPAAGKKRWKSWVRRTQMATKILPLSFVRTTMINTGHFDKQTEVEQNYRIAFRTEPSRKQDKQILPSCLSL